MMSNGKVCKMMAAFVTCLVIWGSQFASADTLIVEPTSYTHSPSEGGNDSIRVTSETTWEVAYHESWITIVREEERFLDYQVDQNFGAEREGTITISNEDTSRDITVYQLSTNSEPVFDATYDTGTGVENFKVYLIGDPGNDFSGDYAPDFPGFYNNFRVEQHDEETGTFWFGRSEAPATFDGDVMYSKSENDNEVTIDFSNYPEADDDGEEDISDHNSRLSGTYIVNQFMDDDVNDDGYTVVSKMEFVFDGEGNATSETLESSTGGDSALAFEYTVFSDGTFMTEFDDEGIVSPDGNIFTISDADASSDDAVFIMIGVKKGTGLSQSTLDGTYVWNRIKDDRVNSVENGMGLVRHEVTFDGSGGGSYITLENSTGYDDQGDFEYDVAPDGVLSIMGNPVGIVSPDGSIFMELDADTADDAVFLGIGVKKGSGLSDSTLDGNYIVNQFGDFDFNRDGQNAVRRLEVTADSGNASFDYLEYSYGTHASGEFNYDIASNGILTSDQDGEEGIVSESGNYFVNSRAEPSGDSIFLMMGIKLGEYEGEGEDEDDDSDSSSGICFIASAAYGSPMAAEVDSLRTFRDRVLLKSDSGEKAVKAYYRLSPPVAEFISRSDGVRAAVRRGLKPLIAISQHLTADTD